MANLKGSADNGLDANRLSQSSSEVKNVQNEAGFGPEGHEGQAAWMSGMEGLTLFEKKCVLINREVNDMGMGRYQWCLWALCGWSLRREVETSFRF